MSGPLMCPRRGPRLDYSTEPVETHLGEPPKLHRGMSGSLMRPRRGSRLDFSTEPVETLLGEPPKLPGKIYSLRHDAGLVP